MTTKHRAGEPRERGFTLIELLVVIIIVGVLAAVAVPVYLRQREKVQTATLKSDLRNVALMLESWYADGHSNTEAVGVASGGYTYQNANGVAGVYPGSGELKQPTMDSAKTTPGTGVIVITTHHAGYCIAGNRRGTPYNYGTDGGPYGPANYGHFLFWDSLTGGIVTRDQIPTSGACVAFR